MRKSNAIQPPAAPANLGPNDFGRIRGQEASKRAITIAIAGMHPVLVIGASGHGKTMLIEASKAIEPAFQAREVTLWNNQKNEQQRAQFSRRIYCLSRCCDMQIEVPAVPWREMASQRPATDTASIVKQVARARAFHPRHGGNLQLSEGCLLLAKQAYDELGFSPRSHDAAVRLARTIADMEESEHIQEQHIAEAVQYRMLDHRA